MQRAGGYAPYYSAYQRLRLESSRPLDAADATQFPPGVHKVRVEEARTDGRKMKYSLVGAAGRRIQMEIKREGKPVPMPGDELRVRIEMRGDCELRICTDGTLVLLDPDGVGHDVGSVAEAHTFCKHWGVELRRPEVVGLA